MKTLPLLLAALMGTGLASCERHAEHAAARLGTRAAVHGARGERGERGGLRRACEADIEQFCAADQKGRDRRECLESHLDKLSNDCKTAIEARKNRHRDKGGDTKPDSGSDPDK